MKHSGASPARLWGYWEPDTDRRECTSTRRSVRKGYERGLPRFRASPSTPPAHLAGQHYTDRDSPLTLTTALLLPFYRGGSR